MATRYIESAADITTLRTIINQLPNAAGLCFKEDDQTLILIDPATGDELVIGTFNGAASGLVVVENEIVVGQSGDVGGSVAMSGDAEVIADGTVTVTGVNGAAITGDGDDLQAALDFIAGIPVTNVSSPLIWNNGGALTLGSV